jgi:hypothetical protein
MVEEKSEVRAALVYKDIVIKHSMLDGLSVLVEQILTVKIEPVVIPSNGE